MGLEGIGKSRDIIRVERTRAAEIPRRYCGTAVELCQNRDVISDRRKGDRIWMKRKNHRIRI